MTTLETEIRDLSNQAYATFHLDGFGSAALIAELLKGENPAVSPQPIPDPSLATYFDEENQGGSNASDPTKPGFGDEVNNIFGGFTGVSGYRGLRESYGDPNGTGATDDDDMYDQQFFVYSAFGGYGGGSYAGLSFA